MKAQFLIMQIWGGGGGWEGGGNCYGTESSPEGVDIFSEALYLWRAG